MIKARVLAPGLASGPTLLLSDPLSFWGGFDPATGIYTLAVQRLLAAGAALTAFALALGIGLMLRRPRVAVAGPRQEPGRPEPA